MMKSTSRYVSNLDLKYLGSKFITIPQGLDVSNNLTEIRKSRNYDLPSIIKTQLAETTIHASLDPTSRGYDQSDFSNLYPRVEKSKPRKTQTLYSQEQQTEINKYRSLIKRIKMDNETIHKQITNLYRQKKINDNEPKTKAVKKVFRIAQQMPEIQRKPKIGSQNKQYNQIYQRLNSQDNPYRSQSIDLQKKLVATNLHKNFESFLVSQNKRVPQFIKNVR